MSRRGAVTSDFAVPEPVVAPGRDADRDARPRAGWLVLLFALVVAAWWPASPWWQSDDFVALHYAADLDRALSDFHGNQYGLEGIVWFYRPLITLSFWLEQAIAGGPSAVLSHGSNVVAHALSACLFARLAARFVGARGGWLAALVWALSPSQAGAIWWAVGRVDSHTTVWLLASALLFLRYVEGRSGTRLPAMLALVAALCSKEHAIVLPGVLALLGAAAVPRGARLRGAVAAWPAAVIVAVYAALRFAVFGGIGGYDAGGFEAGAALGGLGESTLNLLDPLRKLDPAIVPTAIAWLGLAPAALALVIAACRGRIGLIAVLVLCFVGLALPTLQFWSQHADFASLRYFYLPFFALALLLAAGGTLPVVLTIAVFVLPAIDRRQVWFDTFHEAETIHRLLAEDRAELPGETVFVAGLPRQHAGSDVVMFHLGVDRLLRRPFVADEQRRVFALRPLDGHPASIRLPYGDARGLPFAAPTLGFSTASIRALLPPAALPDCDVELEPPGPVASRDLIDLDRGVRPRRLIVHGLRAEAFRVTLFTAGGYLATIVPDRAADGSADGVIDLADVLRARYVTTAGADRRHVIFALSVATTFDLEPAFPVLVEALQDGAATHANRRPLELRFDRALARFVDGG